jgi:hypothetical protein
MKYFLLAVLSLLLASCCDKHVTTAEVEKVDIDVNINEKVAPLTIYCSTVVEYDKEHYFVTNTYVVNLPQGYDLKPNEEKRHFPLRVHTDKDGQYFDSLATKSYPQKTYRNYIITNKETETPVKLPHWE